MLLSNTSEGGTNGTTITAANSGGASGNAWDVVIKVNNVGTIVFDTSQSMHGTRSIKHTTAASADALQMHWTTSLGGPARMWGRIYFRCSSMPVTMDIVRIRSSAGVQIARIAHSNIGEVFLRNTANTVVATSTATMSVDTWYRFEFDWRPGTSVTNTVDFYDGDDTTPIETLSATSDYSSATAISQFHLGNFTNQSNIGNRWFDDVAVSDTGALGPSGVAAATVKQLGALGVG